MDIIRKGHFRLTSGMHSDSFVDAAMVLQNPADVLSLGQKLAAYYQHQNIEVVVGVPYGGNSLAFGIACALKFPRQALCVMPTQLNAYPYVSEREEAVLSGKRVLVVEDVLTTGVSALKTIEFVRLVGAHVVGVCALVDRGSVAVADLKVPNVSVLHNLPLIQWQSKDCPLCSNKVPLDKC